MKDYELTLIFIPDLTEDKIDAMLKEWKVKVKTKEVWGRRVLAYPLLPAAKAGKKHKEGIYVMMKVELKPEEVGELERNLRLEEKVLRHLIVNIKEQRVKRKE